MIVITGAAGFIGSYLTGFLNEKGRTDLVLVDDFSNFAKNQNFYQKKYAHRIHRDQFFDWLTLHGESVSFVYHLGARTDTVEKNWSVFQKLNLSWSQQLWKWCVRQQIPLVYASSAATYGAGEYGFVDNHQIVPDLQPLNPYGISKQRFDQWVLRQVQQPPFWAGLKFFNVYGPNEYHKGRMASVVFHTVKQIRETGQMRLFRSHRSDIQDGEQSRDFIYVADVANMCYALLNTFISNGLYNVGTGSARTFRDLAIATFRAMDITPDISFIDTPVDIRANYQYFTEADMTKWLSQKAPAASYTLEDGIADYVKNYLLAKNYF